MIRIAATASLVLSLSACSWSDVMVQEMKAVPQTTAFGYQHGYRDGCRTGIAREGGIGFDKPAATRDERRMQSEAPYRQGWEQGLRNCSERYDNVVLTSRRGDRYQPW